MVDNLMYWYRITMKNMEMKKPIKEVLYASLTSGDPKFKNARYNEMAAKSITSLSIDVFLITGIVGYLTILKNGWGGAEASDILRHANIFWNNGGIRITYAVIGSQS